MLGIAFDEGLCDFGSIILAESLHYSKEEGSATFEFPLAFALKMRKSTENLNQGS